MMRITALIILLGLCLVGSSASEVLAAGNKKSKTQRKKTTSKKIKKALAGDGKVNVAGAELVQERRIEIK